MRPPLQVCLLLSTFALSQTPDLTPLDGRISGIVMGASGKPVSGATVSLVEQSVFSITDAYPLQIKTDLSGHFDSGETLKHGAYDVYARSEKDGYPDRASSFYRLPEFHPQTVRLIGAKPEAIVDIKLGDKAGVLTGQVIDGDTGQPLDAAVSLVNMQVEDIPNGFNAKRAEAKNGKFRVLVPENTDVHVFVRKPTPPSDPSWSAFDLTVHLQPGEIRNLDIRLYKTGNP